MPCAEDDGVVFSSIRVTRKEGTAVVADAENASVWLTGTLGEKIPPFTSAAWWRTGRNKGKRRTKKNFTSNLQPHCHIYICQMSLVCGVIEVAVDDNVHSLWTTFTVILEFNRTYNFINLCIIFQNSCLKTLHKTHRKCYNYLPGCLM